MIGNKRQHGYTLIELLVAIGVFAIVVTLMTGTFMLSLRGQKKGVTTQNVADNVRYAMEIMAKEMRMGTSFVADTNSGSCATMCRIQFSSNMPNRNPAQRLEFYLANGKIMFDDEVGTGPAADSITSPNVTVSTLSFDVSGVPPTSQPRITIVLEAASAENAGGVGSSITVQTTVSQRSL